MKPENENIESFPTLLIVEDDDGHADLIIGNMESVAPCISMIRVSDGIEALDRISEMKGKAKCIVLTDLKMPRLNGFDLIEKLKGDDSLKAIPVFVFSTTDDPREIQRCYKLGCNFYVTKPIVYHEFQESISVLGRIFSIMKLPSQPFPFS